MHRIHHESLSHHNNYGDFVFWDMLFGTYENPREFRATCGVIEFVPRICAARGNLPHAATAEGAGSGKPQSR